MILSQQIKIGQYLTAQIPLLAFIVCIALSLQLSVVRQIVAAKAPKIHQPRFRISLPVYWVTCL